jgi:hypothetical protein
MSLDGARLMIHEKLPAWRWHSIFKESNKQLTNIVPISPHNWIRVCSRRETEVGSSSRPPLYINGQRENSCDDKAFHLIGEKATEQFYLNSRSKL